MSWLSDNLADHVKARPDALALADERVELSWLALDDLVGRLSIEICRRSKRLDRVAFLSGNRAEHLALIYACGRTGRTFVPLNPTLTSFELEHQLALVGPSIVFCERDTAELVRGLTGAKDIAFDIDELPSAPVEPGTLPTETPLSAAEPAVVFFTSATTGRSKGVEVPQRSLEANSRCWRAAVIDRYGHGRFLNACPLFHGSSVIALDYLSAGSPVFVLSKFTPRGWLRAVTEWQISQTFLVPTMLSMLLKLPDLAEHSPFGLELIGHGAAPISNALARQAADVFGAALFSVYGITEGGGPSIVGQTDPELTPPRPGATFLGKPVTGMATRIIDANGDPVPSGEPGEILLRGDGVMTGYWSDPAATEQVLQGGWLNTQDVGLTDELGNYWALDRRTDLILRGGQNVYPAEIELVLRAMDGVAEAAAVGVHSELWGQTPVAFVVPRPGSELTEAAVLQWCAQRLASYKRPSRVEFVTDIPLSPSGKVLRRELRARIEH